MLVVLKLGYAAFVLHHGFLEESTNLGLAGHHCKQESSRHRASPYAVLFSSCWLPQFFECIQCLLACVASHSTRIEDLIIVDT